MLALMLVSIYTHPSYTFEVQKQQTCIATDLIARMRVTPEGGPKGSLPTRQRCVKQRLDQRPRQRPHRAAHRRVPRCPVASRQLPHPGVPALLAPLITPQQVEGPPVGLGQRRAEGVEGSFPEHREGGGAGVGRLDGKAAGSGWWFEAGGRWLRCGAGVLVDVEEGSVWCYCCHCSVGGRVGAVGCSYQTVVLPVVVGTAAAAASDACASGVAAAGASTHLHQQQSHPCLLVVTLLHCPIRGWSRHSSCSCTATATCRQTS